MKIFILVKAYIWNIYSLLRDYQQDAAGENIHDSSFKMKSVTC